MTALRIAASLFVAAALGCSHAPTDAPPKAGAAKPTPPAKSEGDEVAAERAKLSADDKALVEAQEWCVIAGERLGAMGAPIKVTVKDTPVFVCCKSCEKKALADPDATLAKLAELKEKAKAEKK